MEKNLVLAKKLNIGAWVVTGAVLFLVILMREVKINLPSGWDFSFLPPIYSTLNALTAVALIAGVIFIKKGNMKAHQTMMVLALISSVLFLLAYVVYHFTNPATLYGDLDHNGVLSESERVLVSGSRPYYLILLITHITLAAASLPFILLTFIKAYTNQFNKHRKMAKWVFPIWLYVAVTGPICYFLLMPYY